MEYTKEAVHVGLSRHGLGVFALHSFTIGDCIGPIHGEIVVDAEYSSDYGIDLGDCDRSLEPAAPFRFLNHSCQCNSALVVCNDENEDGTHGAASVWLEILRDIAPGDPITIDYSWPADAAIPCGCGTVNCRGWIVAEEDLDDIVPAQQDAVTVN